MSVYFLRSRDLIKIGFSDNVKARVSALIAGIPFGGEYIGYMPGDRALEKHLHNRFAEYRVRGEWFQENAALMAFIDAMAFKVMPDSRELPATERLRIAEEQAVDTLSHCLAAICGALSGQHADKEKLAVISPEIGISTDRLWQIFDAQAQFATAAEAHAIEDFLRRVNIGARHGWNLDQMLADPEARLPTDPRKEDRDQ